MGETPNKKSDDWVVISEWYRPADHQRWIELQRALSENLKNEGIDRVVMFAETVEGLPLDHPKLQFVQPDRRPTYQDLFAWANRNLPERNVVLANNDISFISCVWPEVKLQQFLVASRHERVGGKDVWFDKAGYHFGHEYSADAWFFRSPVAIKGATFKMGQMGCDNRIAWLAHCSGCEVKNIGRGSKIMHYHESQVRPMETRNRVASPYLAVACDGRKWTELKVGRRELVRSAFQNWTCLFYTLSYIFGGSAKVKKTDA